MLLDKLISRFRCSNSSNCSVRASWCKCRSTSAVTRTEKRSKTSYDEAVRELFAALDVIDARLTNQRYLVGDAPTEADWRLFTTLVRFDPVYVGHFKCNRQRIEDYTALSGYLRDLYQTPGIAETVNLEHITRHYYESHPTINPTGIVPIGADPALDRPHDRAALS